MATYSFEIRANAAGGNSQTVFTCQFPADNIENANQFATDVFLSWSERQVLNIFGVIFCRTELAEVAPID